MACGGAQKFLIPNRAWPCGMVAGIPVPERGLPVFVATLKLDHIYDLGTTPYGQRKVCTVQGGEVSGPRLTAAVMPGGLDFQLNFSNGAMEIEQLLVLRTGDGKYLNLRNAGTAADASDVRLVPDFEAPNASSYRWLNTGKFAARREVDFAAKAMRFTVYDVSGVDLVPTPANSVPVVKPPNVPDQPWDCRQATAGERRGDPIITEHVTLGASQSVGAMKRGNRNIIPITGGTIQGRITGKVLAGGADFQNLKHPMTLDARYLWQTSDGEVIIVRNGGSLGLLAPRFEVRMDSPYAWLNQGQYLSSIPSVGPGGVGLTFYESQP